MRGLESGDPRWSREEEERKGRGAKISAEGARRARTAGHVTKYSTMASELEASLGASTALIGLNGHRFQGEDYVHVIYTQSI